MFGDKKTPLPEFPGGGVFIGNFSCSRIAHCSTNVFVLAVPSDILIFALPVVAL